jgi:hypothetical protein
VNNVRHDKSFIKKIGGLFFIPLYVSILLMLIFPFLGIAGWGVFAFTIGILIAVCATFYYKYKELIKNKLISLLWLILIYLILICAFAMLYFSMPPDLIKYNFGNNHWLETLRNSFLYSLFCVVNASSVVGIPQKPISAFVSGFESFTGMLMLIIAVGVILSSPHTPDKPDASIQEHK